VDRERPHNLPILRGREIDVHPVEGQVEQLHGLGPAQREERLERGEAWLTLDDWRDHATRRLGLAETQEGR
jgi:hypothetical protein